MTSIRTFKHLVCALATSLALPLGAAAKDLDKMMQAERQDVGVKPSKQLHDGAMHGPTPASIPGGQVITTKGLAALVQGRQVPFVLFDVLGGPEVLPNAVPAAWLARPGSFDDAVQQQAGQMLRQLTQGRKDVALVFYCLSRECWMSYNAALRSIHAGYTNVLWYRGGIEAWKTAGLPTQQGQQAGAQQQSQQQPQQNSRPPQQAAASPATFVPVKAVVRGSGSGGSANAARPPPGDLRIGRGKYFSFALPPGWQVGEDGQYALTLHSPDKQALTVMVGNAGFPLNHPPARFAYDKLSQMQLQNLQVGQPRQARPAAGFRQAVEFDVSYSARGGTYRGVAKVSVSPAYDSATMAMTAALAPADQWSGYSTWLPQVAEQLSATNGGAFGMRGVMQQNLQNSVAFGEAAREYRDWSQKNWKGVADARDASVAANHAAVRENLGGVQTYSNPFGTSQQLEMPTTHKYFWRDRQGSMVGTDDPSVNPNMGSTGDWRKMERVGR